MTAPAAWYPDPTDPTLLRYWDGSAWTDHTHPLAAVQQEARESQSSASQPLSRRERRAAESQEQAEREQIRGGVDRQEEQRGESSEVTREGAAPVRPPSGGDTSEARSGGDVPFFGARKIARELQARVAELEASMDRYGLLELAALDTEKRRRREEIAADQRAHEVEAAQVAAAAHRRESELEAALTALQAEIAARRTELADLDREIIGVRHSIEVQELGLYDYEHPAESSADLATRLEALRSEIKSAVREERAAHAASNFTFNNSQAQGRKFVGDMTKILLRAYNAEAENCVKSVRAGNLATAQARLSKASEMIERQGSMVSLTIDPQYHHMRLTEIQLANDYLQALQREKELERARREELREQRKAEQELAREHERLDKERAHYIATLSALEANGDVDGAARLRARIEDVDRALHDVDYRAANIRAGYVYVISNVGAFGDEVVKIGMTRRLEPMDRVNELGDASVPFRFDVHALFFADDAVGIEAMLHQTFADRRVNRVNLRREFFYVKPEEVLAQLKMHSVEIVEFRTDVASEEYRASVALAAPAR
ncbi:DUF4041 domain-containing protein [Rathayibacter sp. AY1A1]|nr:MULTISPECIES: DUF4041 domain-containing protein [unclassified Rathayibacter]PPF46559.1 DUF4041 domain-containing protein [Rathayibacter sp. AY1A1]PPG86369.1 DUF4041 domain-containing protein [Rathayibacter sp. AY1H2]PPH02054.1 DUF4041 domain-containing protein [Rathayibacter sp. AY1G9]